MIRLDVWLTLATGERLQTGELVCADADHQGRYASAFRYTPDYLADPRAFPIDPASLSLKVGEFPADRFEAPLMALEDALPDAWGRRLLILRHGLVRAQQAEPFLLRAQAGQGLGALLARLRPVAGCRPPPDPPVGADRVRDLLRGQSRTR